MSDYKTRELGDDLAARKKGDLTENELRFNPVTGEIELGKRGDRPNPDAVTVDQIAEEGFARLA